MVAQDATHLERHDRTNPARPPAAAPGRDAVALPRHLTADGAIRALRRLEGGLSYVYVVDAARRVVGVLSVRDLVLSRPETPLPKLMRPNPVTVRADMDQKAIAAVFHRYRFVALPVVDRRGRLLGVVTADDVMGMLERGATQEVQRLFGAGADERLDSTWRYSLRMRLPWLLVNLALVAPAASLVSAFKDTVAAWTVLAMYMPIIAGMGGNASAQAMAVAVRGIAVGEARGQIVRRVILRELRVGAVTGLVIGVLAAAACLAIHYPHGGSLAALIGISLLVNHSIACVWGASMPFLMHRWGFDPAQSAAIFTTTLTDLVGFLVLLSLAALLLRSAA